MQSSPPPRRLVVYAGPPKTGSTALQTFFDENAKRMDVMFGNWSYPKSMMTLCKYEYAFIGDEKKRDKARRSAKLFSHNSAGKNVLLACEGYANTYFRDGGYRFAEALQWMNISIDLVEYGLHYRTPRVDHFLSSYMQKTLRTKNNKTRNVMPVRRFICDGTIALGSLAEINVFRVASSYRNNQHHQQATKPTRVVDDKKFPVFIVDMKGAGDRGRDILNALSCGILGVNCTADGLMDGQVVAPKANAHKRDDDIITEEQRNGMDHFLRLRDCLYRDELDNDDMVTFVDRSKELWSGCPASMSDETASILSNPLLLLELVRGAMGCGNSTVLSALPLDLREHSFGFTDVEVATPQTTEVQEAQHLPTSTSTTVSLVALLTLFLLWGLMYCGLGCRKRCKTK